MELFICPICGKEKIKYFSRHLEDHHNISFLMYSRHFINPYIGRCFICGKDTFRRGHSFRETCSRECSMKKLWRSGAYDHIHEGESEIRRRESIIESHKNGKRQATYAAIKESILKNPKEIQRRSTFMKTRWQTAQWQEEFSSAMKKAWEDKESVQKRKESLRKFWDSPFSSPLRDTLSIRAVERNKNSGDRFGRSFSCLYKDISFRSRLEVKIAQYLDEIGEEWHYEPFIIPYQDKESIERRYLPDFFLPRLGSIIEAKSPWTNNEKTVFKAKAVESLGYRFYLIESRDARSKSQMALVKEKLLCYCRN